jgi:hypothetical protein
MSIARKFVAVLLALLVAVSHAAQSAPPARPVSRLFLMGSSLSKSHHHRNYWHERIRAGQPRKINRWN